MNDIIDIDDKRYPRLLKATKGAPKKLYYKGSWDEAIFKNCLAVVGSRHLTSYGRRMTELLVSQIAAAGVTIVSGFMYGGDEAAHKATLSVGGRTIAVMPCGIELIHPEYQKELYQQILENNGLIVSEFAGRFLPTNWTYATRNRIVAGLSKAVLIIEAGLKSGTMITANFAKKFGRKILAVPGPITSEVSQGTAQLIKEGAQVVTEASDILKHFGQNKRLLNLVKQPGATMATGIEQEIIEELKREPLAADDLARVLLKPVSEINTSLSLMQLNGFIKQEGGKYYTEN
jgi:DNA processing protein